MADFGLTPTGFVPRVHVEIREQLDTGVKTAFGQSFDTSDSSVAGTLHGNVAAIAAEIWEVTEQLAASTDRDAATGTRLDAIGAVTGTPRKAAQKSTVTVTITGDPLTEVPTEFRAATASTAAAFETTEDTVLIALDAWVNTTAYAEDDRVTNAGNAYICTTAGTSAGSGGPTTEASSITDGTVTWKFLGEGTATVDAVFTAVDDGVVVATADDLTVIQTETLGVLGVINLEDAVAGALVESDPNYRVRQVEELAGAGASTAAAIRADILELDDVVQCHVFMNLTDTTDGDGVPPHAVEVLVQGGDDQEIIDVLGEHVAAGIVTHGNTSGTYTDEEGTTSTIEFSRPDQILVYNRITLTKVASTYAGDTAARDAVAAYGDAEQEIGKDVIPTSVGASVLPVRVDGVVVAGVAGVLKVVRSDAFTDVIGTPVAWAALTAYSATPGARSVVTNNGRAYICTTAGTSAASGGPTTEGTAITDGSVVWRWLGADITVSTREIAVLDTSRITISSSSATP
jgi:uncharacterized phage protein gp47/JayE